MTFAKTKQLMNDAVTNGVFPSASLLVADDQEILYEETAGDCNNKTIFDVSSLTKPIITTTLAMLAVQKKLFKLNDSVTDYIPSAKRLSGVTIEHLLGHTSGLPSWMPYFREIPVGIVGTEEGREEIIRRASHEKLVYSTDSRTEYSDVGFIVLTALIEMVFKKPLDQLAAEYILKPLHMTESFYRPVQEKKKSKFSFAPTEKCPWRKKVIQGVVDDQNAYAMGGVAGHAGLFSTVRDVHRFVRAVMLSFAGNGTLIDKEIVHRFLDFDSASIAPRHPNTFLLGWDRPQCRDSQAGSRFSNRTIGHLGFTGCSIWIDTTRPLWVILLSNRIHPSAENEMIKAFRPILHNTIWGEIDG